MPQRIEVNRVEVNEPRIPSIPIVRQVGPSVVSPPEPNAPSIQPPIVPVPGFEPPSFRPPSYVPAPAPPPPPQGGPQEPSDDLDVDGVAEYAGSLTLPANPFGGPREINQGTTMEIMGREIPVPTEKEVTLAGTTAMASVAAALLGKSIVEKLVKMMKPIAKKLILTVKQMLGKDLTVQEAQLYFALKDKSVMKVLKAEQKADLLEQRRLRQRRRQRKGSQDET